MTKPRANPLGLSAAAKKNRAKHITAGDAKPIMEGDWQNLFRLKTGLAEEENLDDKLAVQMGSFTEPFGLWWYERQTGRKVDYFSDNLVCQKAWAALTGRDAKPEWQQSVEHLWMGCSLDAMSTTANGASCVLDQKHVGQFRYDELVERYTPAGTHQAIVMDVDYWALSVLVGNGRFEYVEQAIDPFFREELIAREAEFWDYIQRDEEPPDMRPEAPPKPTPKLRSIDMSMEFGSPEWAEFVSEHNWAVPIANEIEAFCETEAAHKAHGAARTEIGKLLPDTVGILTRQTRHGMFRLSRNSAGALTMKTTKDAEAR